LHLLEPQEIELHLTGDLQSDQQQGQPSLYHPSNTKADLPRNKVYHFTSVQGMLEMSPYVFKSVNVGNTIFFDSGSQQSWSASST
jgi:hypothetical protein